MIEEAAPEPLGEDETRLWLVATPIGNLGDVSLRALEILRAVDFVASEDTRHTHKLLTRHGVQAKQIPFHEHNENRVVGKLVALLEQGRSIALVTDAGTPGVSDPGYSLVRAALERGIEPTMVPGPTAFVMALVLSGLPTHAFTFRGFPPRKSGKRKRFIELDRGSPHTLVFYESVHRIGAFLDDAREVLGDRNACLANDLTKKFEAVVRGKLSELRAVVEAKTPKGEYVVVIEGASEAHAKT